MIFFQGADERLRDLLVQLYGLDSTILDRVHFGRAPEKFDADMGTPAAFVLAKVLHTSPHEIAEKISSLLRKESWIREVKVEGGGFVNVWVVPSIWGDIVQNILLAGDKVGHNRTLSGESVNVEYVSANVTGLMHLGHVRNAVVGDSLANILASQGADVVREYYVNDRGNQVDIFVETFLLNVARLQGEHVEIPEGRYDGPNVVTLARKFLEEDRWHLSKLTPDCVEKMIQDEGEQYCEIRLWVVDRMLEDIRKDLAALGVHQDVFTSEKALGLGDSLSTALKDMEEKGWVYRGMQEHPPLGGGAETWKPEEQLFFKSSAFGDDVDRTILKHNGGWAYLTGDFLNHVNKLKRGFSRLYLVLGSDHVGYYKRIEAIVEALSDGKVHLTIIPYQMVRLIQGKKVLRMSKRRGNVVTFRQLYEAVGRDAIRFFIVMRKADVVLDFDMDRAVSNTRDNPVFYVQYARARCVSVLRMAESLGFTTSEKADVHLFLPWALPLLRQLAYWPDLVTNVARTYDIQRIPHYLLELAHAFHVLWTAGKDDATMRFIRKDAEAQTGANLALVRAVMCTLDAGLNLLGVEPVDELR